MPVSRRATCRIALLLWLVPPPPGRAGGTAMLAAEAQPPALADLEAPPSLHALTATGAGPLERSEALPGPPLNLRAGAFQALLDRMWRASPTFRQQCRRLASRSAVTVSIRADPTRAETGRRAVTLMTRRAGTLVSAEVVLFSVRDATELIAHEIEHVIEQLDGAALRPGRCGGTAVGFGESCRAVDAGRRVARETQERAEPRHLVTVPLADTSGNALGPEDAAISANGRYVALRSEARLTDADVNDTADLYVLDLDTGRLRLETPRPGWADAYSGVLTPSISGDGGVLAFEAVARDETALNGLRWDVVILDRESATIQVIATGRQPHAPRPNSVPAISEDGSAVAFESVAPPVTGVVSGRIDIDLVRLRTGEVEPVAVAGARVGPARTPHGAARRRAAATEPARLDELGDQNVTPAMSADGRFVAFTSMRERPCDTALKCLRVRQASVYLRDTFSKTTVRISQGWNGAEPDGSSSWPSISGDGRFIAFASTASNLVTGDRNRHSDVFVRDTVAGTTELISRRPDGHPGNAASRHPVIAGDGGSVVFESLASDLLCVRHCSGQQQDLNLLWDVFLVKRNSLTMSLVSGDDNGSWAEPSRSPAVDRSGRVVAFLSRHPIGDRDVDNDDDLYVWLRGTPGAANGRIAVSVDRPASNRR